MKLKVGRINHCFLMIIMSAIFLSVGCSSKKSGEMTPGQDGEFYEGDLNARQDSRFGEGSIPMAEEDGIFRNVHFGFDSSTLDDRARQEIEYNRQVLESNPGLSVRLEGHCDERGTAQYNLALGQKRARAVYDMLLSLGVSPARLEVISYGAEVPLDPASNEMAWAKNRRVHFGSAGGVQINR
ncbi:MAG: OmpA family protein [Deltaproteobacteria bacterium]|nr:OmpA family protein [Deltaproteobacteria bacterium]